MKKIIGILGVAVIAAMMFFTANTVNGSNSNIDLTSLMEMNTANAECDGSKDWLNSGGCSFFGNCYWGGAGQGCDPWAWDPEYPF